MKYRLRVLRRARKDVDAILDWIANEQKSPQGAASWLRAYENAAALLLDAPQSDSVAPENEYVDLELRQFLFKTRRGRTYRGVFTVDGDEILILRVRGPGQAQLEPDEFE